MSLHQYKIDFSPLSLDEKNVLVKRIEDCSFNDLHWKQDLQTAVFSVDEKFDVNFLDVPAVCHLSRVF